MTFFANFNSFSSSISDNVRGFTKIGSLHRVGDDGGVGNRLTWGFDVLDFGTWSVFDESDGLIDDKWIGDDFDNSDDCDNWDESGDCDESDESDNWAAKICSGVRFLTVTVIFRSRVIVRFEGPLFETI